MLSSLLLSLLLLVFLSLLSLVAHIAVFLLLVLFCNDFSFLLFFSVCPISWLFIWLSLRRLLSYHSSSFFSTWRLIRFFNKGSFFRLFDYYCFFIGFNLQL